jgi:antitoxin VapB
MQKKTVNLFRNNRSQAVRIPADWEMPGTRVIIHRDGDRLIIEPLRRRGLAALLHSWEPLTEKFPEIEDLPADEEDRL